MNILKKLATPFVAIWRWIKETAWVQPLIIVGIIFAIIFSIPSITKGIQNLINQSDSEITFFEKEELSMEGTRVGEWNSEADNFFRGFEEAQTAWANGNKDEAKSALNQYSNGNDRFFLFFTQDSCDGCANLKTGLEYLEENWDTYMPQVDKNGVEVPSMSFVSIIPNREYDDDEYYEENDITPIGVTVTSPQYLYFYDEAMSVIKNTDFYLNSGVATDDGSSVQSTLYANTEKLSDPVNLQTPTCVLIDLTDANTSNHIITSIFYSPDGSDKYTYASFIKNAWTYDGIFSPDYRN